MTNTLTEAREALTAALTTAGVRVLPDVPQTFSPPLCWIAPRQPYRKPGQTFARKRVALSIVCLAAQGTNSKALADVDQYASDVADAIEQMDGVALDGDEEIGVPQLYSSAQGQEYLGASVNVIVSVTR